MYIHKGSLLEASSTLHTPGYVACCVSLILYDSDGSVVPCVGVLWLQSCCCINTAFSR
jgi:hypothetical protein